ncbi:hypothetical protein ACMHYB_48990 [Sorangium sp. So ce1128]
MCTRLDAPREFPTQKNPVNSIANWTIDTAWKVMVDDMEAEPGEVVFCKRTRELTATLAGILQQCTDVNGDATILASECDFTEEEISLLLDTGNANAFNWVQTNVGVGEHTIKVLARIDSSTSSQLGTAVAEGYIGKGSVVVSEQRLVK